MKIQLTSKEDVRLAVKIMIDQYERYVNRLDPDLDLVVVVSIDRSYMNYDVSIYYTYAHADSSSTPWTQGEDKRLHEDTKIPLDVSIEKLENEITSILDKLSQIRVAA